MRSIIKSNCIDKISGNNKVSRVKTKAKCLNKKNRKIAKFKILVRFENNNFSSKSIKQAFESSFFIFKAKLAFIKLR